jgi:hypothetical protein
MPWLSEVDPRSRSVRLRLADARARLDPGDDPDRPVRRGREAAPDRERFERGAPVGPRYQRERRLGRHAARPTRA